MNILSADKVENSSGTHYDVFRDNDYIGLIEKSNVTWKFVPVFRFRIQISSPELKEVVEFLEELNKSIDIAA